jgi:hypothetical protein
VNSDLSQYLPSPQAFAVICGSAIVIILVLFFVAPERTARMFALFFLTIRSAARLKRALRGQSEPEQPRSTTDRRVKVPNNVPLGTISDYLRPPVRPRSRTKADTDEDDEC